MTSNNFRVADCEVDIGENENDLFLALLENDWERVEKLLSSKTITKSIKNDSNDSILYTACTYSVTNIPIEIVKTIFHLAPKQIFYLDGNSRSALHRSSYSSYDKVVQFLLDHGLEMASKPDRYGKLPLHLALGFNNGQSILKVVKPLLLAYPNAIIVTDRKGHTPLYYFYRRWNDKLCALRCEYGNDFNRVNREYNNADCIFVHNMRSLFILLLQVLVYGNVEKKETNESDSIIPLFHKALKLKLITSDTPTIFIQLLLDLTPQHEFVRKDNNGDTSLHVIAMSRHHNYGLIDFILNKNPHAAMERNNKGELPIALAIKHGNDWSFIKKLLDIAPTTISSQVDGKTSLFPFMIASCSAKASVLTTYRLLRMDPSLVKSTHIIAQSDKDVEKMHIIQN